MPFRRSLRASLVAAGLAAAGPVLAESATFSLTLSGIPLGTVTLQSDQSGRDYSAVSKITPNGLLSAVTGYSFDGRARGLIDAAGKVTPRLFEADSTSPRATRRTEIEWRDDGVPTRVSVVPPRKYAADPDRVAGALDPVSASFALLRDNAADAICDVSIDVFDGSRRSRLSLGKPEQGPDGVICAGVYAKLEGERHSFSPQAEYPFVLTFTEAGDGRMRLERIETQTRFGNAVVSRRG